MTQFFVQTIKNVQIKIQEKPNEFNTASSLISSQFSCNTSCWYLNSTTKTNNIYNY